MSIGFFKKLAELAHPRRRRGVVVFLESQWDAPANTPVGRFMGYIRKEVRVVDVRRDGRSVRVTCDCDQFEPVPIGGPIPQYLPGATIQNGPEGETAEVTFRRKGAAA